MQLSMGSKRKRMETADVTATDAEGFNMATPLFIDYLQ